MAFGRLHDTEWHGMVLCCSEVSWFLMMGGAVALYFLVSGLLYRTYLHASYYCARISHRFISQVNAPAAYASTATCKVGIMTG